MLPSDENAKTASFSSPTMEIPVEKSCELLDYPKYSSFQTPRHNEKHPSTLQGCVLHSFLDANPHKLECWIDKVTLETRLEIEPLLFSVFVCAGEFRITQPDVRSVLGTLWTWLTDYPRSLNHRIAEIVIEAIAPRIAKSIARRGWQRGVVNESYVRKKGAPPKTRGAWVAGLIVEHFLRQAGASATAVPLSTDLISVLLGRQVEVNEFYRFRKSIAQGSVETLALELACECEHWIAQNSIRAKDTYTITQGPEQYALWRIRNRPLTLLLHAFPGDELPCLTLKRMPGDLWNPFL